MLFYNHRKYTPVAYYYTVEECVLTTGPRAACGPPQRFQWHAEAFRKNLLIWICWKACGVTFVSAELLALDKVQFHKNNTFSVYHFALIIIYFSINHRSIWITFVFFWWHCVFFLTITSGEMNSVLPNTVNLSIYPLNPAFSKWPWNQINCPFLQ